nr:hypothetical protein [uncultured Methanoregula sp.]
MVNDYCESLSRQISIQLFESDLSWLIKHGIERNEFIRNVVHARIATLKGAPHLSDDRSVPIINIFSKGQNNQKSEQAAAPLPLRAYQDLEDPKNLGGIRHMSKSNMIETEATKEGS